MIIVNKRVDDAGWIIKMVLNSNGKGNKMQHLITVQGKQYTAHPHINIVVDGVRQFGISTFEEICNVNPGKIVKEVFSHPLYVSDDSHEEGGYFDYGLTLEIINRHN
jgi:hypothetical protein